MHVDLVRLGPDDAAEYRELMLEAYAASGGAFTSTVDERAALPFDWWLKRLAPGAETPERVHGTRVDGRLAGAATLSFEHRERIRHRATLVGMIVRPTHRGIGLGEAIVRSLLEAARSRPGMRIVVLDLTDGNDAARRLYERCGFETYGVMPLAIRVGEAYLSKRRMVCDLERIAGPPQSTP